MDAFYEMHEQRYVAWMIARGCPSSPMAASEYFNYSMFRRRDMRVECDQQHVASMACALHNYYLGGFLYV